MNDEAGTTSPRCARTHPTGQLGASLLVALRRAVDERPAVEPQLDPRFEPLAYRVGDFFAEASMMCREAIQHNAAGPAFAAIPQPPAEQQLHQLLQTPAERSHPHRGGERDDVRQTVQHPTVGGQQIDRPARAAVCATSRAT